MCILSVSADQETEEAVAAFAHNLETVKGDLEQLRRVLEIRNPEFLRAFSEISTKVQSGATSAWNLWREFVPGGEHFHDEHQHNH